MHGVFQCLKCARKSYTVCAAHSVDRVPFWLPSASWLGNQTTHGVHRVLQCLKCARKSYAVCAVCGEVERRRRPSVARRPVSRTELVLNIFWSRTESALGWRTAMCLMSGLSPTLKWFYTRYYWSHSLSIKHANVTKKYLRAKNFRQVMVREAPKSKYEQKWICNLWRRNEVQTVRERATTRWCNMLQKGCDQIKLRKVFGQCFEPVIIN